MSLTERQAWERLQTLTPMGYLRIITSRPDPDGSSYPPSDPRHWICHTVVKVERFGLISEGRVRAYSAEGDMTDGPPLALLRRLMAHEVVTRQANGRREPAPIHPLVLPMPQRVDVTIEAQPAQTRVLVARG